MDLPLLIRHRLKELGIEQRELAAATQVTESYISQLRVALSSGLPFNHMSTDAPRLCRRR